jgi:hypothetical protein
VFQVLKLIFEENEEDGVAVTDGWKIFDVRHSPLSIAALIMLLDRFEFEVSLPL